jgi:virulence-associated protein VapD
MYAIAFDLDTDALNQHYPGTAASNNAYADLKKIFNEKGFKRQQGSVYFADDKHDNYDKLNNPVAIILVVQEIQRRLPWFRLVVRDIRMLRIEGNDDLGPALDMV